MPSLTVVVVSRKDIVVFDTLCVNFKDGWIHARGHIDVKTMEYLTPEDPKPYRFYLLPKIHKENNPGRPIVSANGHPTEKILEFIDFHFRTFPMMTELPHAEKYGNNEQFKNL